MASYKTRIEQLVGQLHEQLPEVEDKLDVEPSQPGRPCRPGRLEELEEVLGFPLPPDYRYFLSLHNGWAEIAGNITFFSVDELLDVELQDELTDEYAEFVPEAEVVLCICAHTQEDRGLFLVFEEDEWMVLDGEEGVFGDPATFLEMFEERVAEVLSYLDF